jgi:histone acetyltransferase (RNA polymerase elongator complex component)
MSKKYVIPVFVPHLGCPHQCVFCDQKKISGHKGFPDVKNTIEYYLKNFKYKDAIVEVAFYGGTFTAIPINIQEKLLRNVNEFVKEKKVHKIRLSTRPDSISPEILDLLKRYNVKTIELGVQSLDNEVLKLSERGHDKEAVLKASDLIKKSNFLLGIQLMPGLPGDNRDRIFKTVKEVINIKPSFVRIYPTIVIKGTKLEEMYNEGKYTPLTLKEAIDISADMYSSFNNAEIKIIRIGLQPTEDLIKGDNVVAGPFHPAFGEMVKNKVAFNYLCEIIDDYKSLNPVSELIKILIPYNKASIYLGQKKINYKKLNSKYGDNVFIKIDKKLNNEIIIGDEKNIKKYASIF